MDPFGVPNLKQPCYNFLICTSEKEGDTASPTDLININVAKGGSSVLEDLIGLMLRRSKTSASSGFKPSSPPPSRRQLINLSQFTNFITANGLKSVDV